ncbi:unnamed protein product [Rotaria sp. Silwood1]|nr:unnamed protein product [Rotaria sp. Silwood1]CAF1688481.1 unnamed protein product [Rotaria sp. Silwood1]
MELDFAEEQNIKDYNQQDQRENVTQQINKYSDLIEKEFMKTSEEIQQIIEESSSEKRLLQIRTLSQTLKKVQIRIIGDSKV